MPVKSQGKLTGEYEDEITDPGASDKRLLVVESEFAQTLKVMARDGNTLSPVLRDAWDGRDLGTLTKNSPTRATAPHISVVGHVTITELRRSLSAVETANGFANRFLFMLARRSKLLPEGGGLSDETLASLGNDLGAALSVARRSGISVLARNAEARDQWAKVYGPLSTGRPGLLGAATARAEAQVMRLAVLYALLDLSHEVCAEHLGAALALWDYAYRSTAYIFGDALGDPIADEALRAICEAGENGVSRTHLRDHFQRHKAAEVALALRGLEAAALIRRASRATGGRPEERWYPCDRSDQSSSASGLPSLPSQDLSITRDAARSTRIAAIR